MTEQLPLFEDLHAEPADAPEQAPAPEGDLETGSLDELFRLTPAWRSGTDFLALLDGIARFPAFSPLNGFLIHLQDREAVAVATARTWARRHRRRLKPGARPLAILARSAPVMFVFDVRDTEGPSVPPEAPQPPASADRRLVRAADALAHNCRVQNISLREIEPTQTVPERALRVSPAVKKAYAGLEHAARYLVLVEAALGPEERYAAVVRELAHIFCGHLGIDSDAWWAERDDLDLERVEVEAASVAYLVCRRRGLLRAAQGLASGYAAADRRLPVLSLNAVVQAATHIEAMSRSAWTRPLRRGRYQ
jgi:hypothetical protein